MSLFDTDKKSDDRSVPLPTSHDQLTRGALSSRGTNSTNYITPATNTSLDAAKNGQFTIIQVGTYTMPFSFVGVNDPGAGNFGNLFQTLYRAPHNLGFQPGIQAYLQSGSTYTSMPHQGYISFTGSQVAWFVFEILVDATNVYVTLNTTSYGTAVAFSPPSFKWYLLYQGSK